MRKKIKELGPGILVAAAFIGPGTVTTATLAGSGYGYTLLWAVLFSILATIILQEMTVRLGIIGKKGLGEAVREKTKNTVWYLPAILLILSAILLGNAAYEAGNLTGAVLGFPYFSQFTPNPLLLALALIAFLLLFSGTYQLIERFIVLLVCIMGFVFLVAAIVIKPDFSNILTGLFRPSLPSNSLLLTIGLIGTTVVPYNLFLHAASVKQKWKGKNQLTTARWDAVLSIFFGCIITMSILITSAVAFEGNYHQVSDFKQLAVQLEPLLGNWSTLFLATGFLAAGLSSSITAPLAAAYAVSEIFGWKADMKEKSFRFIWIIVLGMGILFSSFGIRPTQLILFAQAADGILLPVFSIFLVWIMNDQRLLGRHTNSWTFNLLAGLVIVITIVLGIKSILTAWQLV